MEYYYTGIGARATPGPLVDFFENSPLSRLRRWGYWLGILGMTLRSGGADGADHAFENGCDKANGKKEIYLPWVGFNGSDSDLHYIPIEAFEIAADVYGTGWKFLKPAVQKLMARNILQIMGIGLDEPSKFVLCWTPDGCTTKKGRSSKTGGTGQAIAYADEMNIPVFNLFHMGDNMDTFHAAEEKFIEFFENNLCEFGISEKINHDNRI